MIFRICNSQFNYFIYLSCLHIQLYKYIYPKAQVYSSHNTLNINLVYIFCTQKDNLCIFSLYYHQTLTQDINFNITLYRGMSLFYILYKNLLIKKYIFSNYQGMDHKCWYLNFQYTLKDSIKSIHFYVNSFLKYNLCINLCCSQNNLSRINCIFHK